MNYHIKPNEGLQASDLSAALNQGVLIKDQDLEPTIAFDWRKGISLYVLVTLTLLIAGYSHWRVQPNIQQSYLDLCRKNYVLLDCDSIMFAPANEFPPSRLVRSLSSQESGDGSAEGGFQNEESRRAVLEQCQLCLRRLMIWEPKDDSLRFQAAIVSNLLAESFATQLRSIESNTDQPSNSEMLEANAKMQIKECIKEMRRVQRMNGPFANNASLWAIRQRLWDDDVLKSDELNGMETEIRRLISESNAIPIAKWMLGEVLVRKALGTVFGVEWKKRISMLQEADELFQSVSSEELEVLAWSAEARGALDPTAGKELAWKSAQTYWANEQLSSNSPEMISSAFDCLIMSGSIKESQSFIVQRTASLPTMDKSCVRNRAATACLRLVLANAIGIRNELESGSTIKSSVQDRSQIRARNLALLSMAIQLSPDRSEILDFFEAIVLKIDSNSWLDGIRIQIESRDNAELIQLVSSLSSVVDDTIAFDNQTFERSIKSAQAYAVTISKLLLRFAGRPGIDNGAIERVFEAINRSVPELLVVWFDRANFHVRFKQYDKALLCFETLRQRMPDNPDIIRAMEEARKNQQEQNQVDKNFQ